MNKERFLGHIDHIKKIAEDGYYDGCHLDMIDEIIQLAEELDPPSISYPVWPPQDLIGSTVKSVTNWSIKKDKIGNGWSVVYEDK